MNQAIKEGTEKQLQEKGVVYRFGEHWELSTEYRVLFGHWQRMRYSVTRSDVNNAERWQCLLASDEAILFFDREGEQISLNLVDFSEQRMDLALGALAELEQSEAIASFNVTMPVEEYMQLAGVQSDAELAAWQRKLGLDATLLRRFLQAMATDEAARLLLVEDHLEQIGYMARVVPTPEAVFAVKHVTYAQGREKAVMLMGDAKFVIDSIYNF